ncbi:hypothetical protein [Paraburkholderia xenovorans]
MSPAWRPDGYKLPAKVGSQPLARRSAVFPFDASKVGIDQYTRAGMSNQIKMTGNGKRACNAVLSSTNAIATTALIEQRINLRCSGHKARERGNRFMQRAVPCRQGNDLGWHGR